MLLGKEIIFPRSCFLCKAEIEEGLFCKECRNGLVARKTVTSKENIDAIYVFYSYEQGVKEAIHQIKFMKNKELPYLLNEEAIIAWESEKPAFEILNKDFYIVSIPTDKERLKERGFDLPKVLFKDFLVKQGGIWLDCLVRTRNTLPMVDIMPEERRSNLEGCFAITGDVKNKNIIIVDDILTTGTTMETAALALKEAGADKIYGIAFCGAIDNIR